ncbi:MAG: serine protease [Pseudomonadota bacterium]
MRPPLVRSLLDPCRALLAALAFGVFTGCLVPDALSAPVVVAALAPEPATTAPMPSTDAVSVSASRAYERARSQLVQIRTVVKGRGSQTSAGSGFFVSAAGHILTNFHVVSETALEPQTHDLLYVTADGQEGRVDLLMIDVRHDLALLKVVDTPSQPFEALTLRPAQEPLRQGERIVSLGVPLDVGFAIVEGLYNGLAERSFYPQIFFAGSLNSGMSGGPALDQQGRVVGVNVARRSDGEQVSFLVPAPFARELLARGRDVAPMQRSAYPELSRQLLVHQEELTQRFIEQGWRTATHARYSVPVPPDRFMRCWGSNQAAGDDGLSLESAKCSMDSDVFAGAFTTGSLSTRHETYSAPGMGPWRFAALHSRSFANETFTRLSDAQMTAPQCHEDFLERQGLTLRAVVCLRAYRRLPALYDVSVLVATLDQPTAAVLARFDGEGLSHANALKLTRHYLSAFGRLP